MPQTNTGTPGAGSGVNAALGATTAENLHVGAPGIGHCQERTNVRRILHVAATGAFRINYMFTTDGGTSWFIGEQYSSAAVTVDGGTALYTQAVNAEVHLGVDFRVQIYNPGGGSIAYAYEVREYC